MKRYGFKRLLVQATKAFAKGDYKKAIQYYSIVLRNDPKNREAKIGLLLSDMAQEGNEEALAIYDYYTVLKEEKNLEAEEIIEEIIGFMDSSTEIVSKTGSDVFFEYEEGISYDDFKALVKSRGSFKRAFEDIMFSTKVIINEKRDFLDFLEGLIENGFEEIALTYLEDATMLYPADMKILSLFEKIDPRDFTNDS